MSLRILIYILFFDADENLFISITERIKTIEQVKLLKPE